MSVYSSYDQGARGWAWLYAVVLVGVALYGLLRLPIIALDCDLWYHLSHGRHIYTEGEIPTTSYFSFREPQRQWVDYYWLFQAMVYPLHSATGYTGLVVLRALLFGFFALGVGLFLLGPKAIRGSPGIVPPGDLLWRLLLFGLVISHGYYKYQMLRPHTFSYLLLPWFFLLAESNTRRLWFLPFLAALWTNVHGVEYPVMLLVCGAYSAEIFLRNRQRGGAGPEDLRGLAAHGLAMAAVFATPHGADLVRVPFTSTFYASNYIDELSQLEWSEFFTYGLQGGAFTHLTTSNLLLLMGFLALLGGAIRGRLRLPHVLLFLGGVVLLAKAVRFTHEMSLLALPLLRAHGPLWPSLSWRGLREHGAALAACVLLLLTPFAFLAHEMPDEDVAWPLTLDGLPHGIVRFLDGVEGEGRVMNNPNVGGYLQWALPSRYQIFMDLEIPFLFHDEDMFELASAFYDPAAFDHFLERYDPPFLAVTLAAPDFPRLVARHPRYQLVFFDDTARLYVDAQRFPAIAERHALQAADPHTLGRTRFSSLDPESRLRLRRELESMATIAPEIQSVGQALAILDNLEGAPGKALERIELLIPHNPSSARGHAIRGDALRELDRLEDAVASYEKALEQSEEPLERASIQRSLSIPLARLGRHEEAFLAFEAGVGRFNIEASIEDLYRLGVLAAAAGRVEQAGKLLDFAAWKVPAGDMEWERRIAEARSRLE